MLSRVKTDQKHTKPKAESKPASPSTAVRTAYMCLSLMLGLTVVQFGLSSQFTLIPHIITSIHHLLEWTLATVLYICLKTSSVTISLFI